MIQLKEILEKNLPGTQLGMKRLHMPKLVHICILSIPLILLILIFFSFSISTVYHKHHNLICSIYDFIIVAKKSSRVAVFVTCIVIMITIFLGSALKSPAGDYDQLFSLSPSVYEVVDAIEKGNDGESNTDYGDDEEEEEEEFHGYDGYDEDNDDNINSEDADSEDDIDSSDLQMKIEEFIDKVYKTWKEEMVAERLLCIAATEFN